MIGSLYRDRPSWLHAWPAGAKLLGLALLTTALFVASSPRALVPLSAGCVAVYLSLGRVGPAGRRPVIATLAACGLLLAFHAWLGQAWIGATSALRLLSACCLGVSLALTTRFDDLLGAFERIVRPLRHVGVPAPRLALMLGLMVRFTDQFFVQWQLLDDAYRLRTGRSGGARLLAPLCIRMLLTARRVADALDARLGP